MTTKNDAVVDWTKIFRAIATHTLVGLLLCGCAIGAETVYVPTDYGSIQEAINYLAGRPEGTASNPNTVFVETPGSNHYGGITLNAINYIRITGELGASKVHIEGGLNGITITNSCTGITIENFRFSGQSSRGIVTGTGDPNDTILGNKDHKLENLTVENAGLYGIEVFSKSTEIVSCEVINSDSNGIHAVNNRIDGLEIHDTIVRDGDGHGIIAKGNQITQDDITIDNCDVYNNDNQGILCSNLSDLTINDCDVYNNKWTGIQLENFVDGARVTNCSAHGNNSPARGGEAGIWVDCSLNVLVEDCKIYDNQLGLKVGGNATGPVGYSQYVVFRFNKIYDNDVHLAGDRRGGGGSYHRAKDLAMCHNTFWGNGTTLDVSPEQNGDGEDRGGFGATQYEVTSASNSNISFVNNIVGATYGLVESHVMQFYNTAEIRDLNYNVYYSGSGHVDEFHVGGSDLNFTGYQVVGGIDEDDSYDSSSSPIVSSPDLEPQNDAESNAGPLTNVDSGSGTNVYFDNASYFVVGDVIKTSTGATATILDIDYSTDYVELSHSVSVDNDIYLNRTGNTNVDIGAVQD